MRTLAATVTLLVLASWGGLAHADKIIVDRVDARPSVLHGQTRVRALVSATETAGAVVEAGFDDKKGSTLKLKVGAQISPPLIGAFEHAEVELNLVLAVPTSFDFDADFEVMKAALDAELLAPLAKLGPRVRVQVLGYGSEYSGSKGLTRVADAQKALANLTIDPGTDDIPLAAVVARAAAAAEKPAKSKEALLRAAVVLVSKGVVRAEDEVKAAITKVGAAAAKKNIRIHTLGYSPSEDGQYHAVRPLLALGELSRTSLGTFRWIKTAGGWSDAIGQLTQELRREHVVTFFAPTEEIQGKTLSVSMPLGTRELALDKPVPIGKVLCGRELCEASAYCVKQECVERRVASGGGVVTKVLIIGGAGVGAMAALLGVLALVRRRRGPAVSPYPMATAMPGMPGQPFPGAPGVPGAPPGFPAGYPAAAAPAPVAAPGGAVLIVLSGPAAGTRVPLRHGFTVGKAPGSDLDLSHDGYASSNHAHITFDGAAWQVNDHDSTNGTFANGVRITQTRLDPGMTIRFGSTEVRFWIG